MPSSGHPVKSILSLPDEIIIGIFKLLPLEDLLTCENVCCQWRKLSRDSTLWRNLIIVYSGKPGETEVAEEKFQIIANHSHYIQCIKLQYIYDYSHIVSLLANCDNITSLELVMCRVGKGFSDYIKKWRKLRKLNLKNSLLFQAGNEMLIDFQQFNDLVYLSLSDFGLSSANCSSMINCCTHMSHIFIEKIKTLGLDDVKMLIVAKQKVLNTLHVYGGDAIDDKCMHLLSHCRQLKDLAIIRCENLSDEGLLSLGKLQQLEHLQIWNNVQFSEIALLSTLGSPNLFTLTSLSLSRIKNISPVIVDVISQYYGRLKFLAVYQCQRIINTDYERQLKYKFKNIDVVLY